MFVPQKAQYALRAIFELAKRYGDGPVKISEIAKIQAIPARFLEVIMTQLKQAGFVESRRGRKGGHSLARSPQDLTVGDVMRFMQGPIGPIACAAGRSQQACAFHGDCVFLPMWQKVRKATEEIYDGTTFQDLVDQERQGTRGYVPRYSI